MDDVAEPSHGPLAWVAVWTNRAFVVVAAVAVVAMMAHVTIDVAWRALANGALIGTVEIVSYYYMVVLVMLAFGYVELRREHIRVDLFVQRMPAGVQLAFYLAACAMAAAYFGVLLYQSVQDAWRATAQAETVMANFVFFIWPARWALPLGWLGILLAVIANAARAVQTRRAL
ncbi:TRAP transporter small permease [Jannaschia sp. LMIT008]|uniref:TRAP transporter small permease n=1 Tax=Jannaschia maritima TaxID=3032585 RepID=UPI0028118F8F|nr:TRAP transporter small permease [Jannaschia sp. LMIT008]